MPTDIDNLAFNRAHYNAQYSQVGVEKILSKLRRLPEFLADATATDTSWHGMYAGDLAARLPGKRVLEIGSGDGLNALIMAALGADVTANDISSETQRIIREVATRVPLQNVRSATGDFLKLNLPERSFDFVIGKAFLHHLTHEQEMAYLEKIARLVKADGEARFFEPATNSQILDRIRWMVPVPGRPSRLNRRAFAAWKASDPHPERENSSAHFVEVGRRFFGSVEIVPSGSIERLSRFMPVGDRSRRFRRWAHRADERLPGWLRSKLARSQLIVYRSPRVPAALSRSLP